MKSPLRSLSLSTCLSALVVLASLSTTVRGQSQNTGLKLTSGVVNYVNVPYDATLVPQGGITVEAWITYDENLPSGWCWPTIMRQNPVASNEAILFRVDAANISNRNLRFYIRGASGSVNCLWSFPAGRFSKWTHVAGTYDGTAARIYVDGQLVQTAQGAVGAIRDLNSQDTKIGNGDGLKIETWNGELDEVRLWPFARSGAEILATKDYELQRVPGLVSTWNFNGSAADSSGGNNGQWVGTPAYASNTLTLTPFPVSGAFERGNATVQCGGASALTIGSIAAVGNAAFTLHATGGATNSSSIYLMGSTLYSSAVQILGIDLWADISTVVLVLPAVTNSLGSSELPFPIPNDSKLSGLGLAMQAIHVDANCSKGLLAATPGLVFGIR
jgi:hypothetical protein